LHRNAVERRDEVLLELEKSHGGHRVGIGGPCPPYNFHSIVGWARPTTNILRRREGLGHFVESEFGIARGDQEFELEVAEMDNIAVTEKILSQRRNAALVDVSAVTTAQIQDIQAPIVTDPQHRMKPGNRGKRQGKRASTPTSEQPAFTRGRRRDPRSTRQITAEKMELVTDDRLDIVFRRSAALRRRKHRSQQTDQLVRIVCRFKREGIGQVRIAGHESQCPLERTVRNR
jgi:hypothetical protein